MAIDEASPDLNSIDDDSGDLHKIARWVAEVDLYNRETKNWDTQSKKIVERYKDERKSPEEENRRRFNVLWSNIQTTLPALYAKNPKPDIQRRFKDDDPIGRVTSSVLERSVSYFVDTDFFAGTVRGSVLDYLLSGRGTTWVRYEPKFEGAEVQATDDAEEGDETKEGETLAYEEVIPDYVNREDFGHNICRTWDEVWCGWRVVYMDRTALVRRFKDKGNEVPLDHRTKDNTGKTLDDGIAKAVIYELWDKSRKCAVWFHKTMPEALDVRPDPLKLDGFFPFPQPMLTNLANDSLIPVPDYREYQDQADELDSLTGRIASIQKSLKVAGVYDASAPALKRLLGEGVENELIPVESWAVFAEKGGLKSAIDLLPLKDIVSALTELYNVRAQVKNDLYEITGMSDIVRGVSNPDETAAAQEIKSNFATMRIGDRQREVQRFVRAIIRIMVDVICNHFQDETIKTISGVRLFTQAEKQMVQQTVAHYQAMAKAAQAQQQPPPPPPQPPNGLTQEQVETMMSEPAWDEVLKLVRDNALRCFRIDIETNSTIKQDEEADKASRVEFVKAIGEYLANALPAAQQHPELAPFLMQGLQFLARGFPVGKDLEATLHVAMAKLEKAAANPPPQRPDPDMAKVQADAQLGQQKLQNDAQMQQQKLQGEAQLEQMKSQVEERTAQRKMEIEASVDQHRNELEAQRESLRMANEQRMAEMKLSMQERIEIEKAHIQAAASIEVARINAAADDGAAAEQREVAAEGDDMDTQKVIEASTKTHTEGQAKADERHKQMMDAIGGMAKQHQASMDALAKAHSQAQQQGGDTTAQILKALTAEKELVRDPQTGKAIGVRHKATGQEKAAALQ